ncbi:glucoamylase family protein [Dyella sp. Tek66A03]|uniref:glucoamylase family protein n=1 Tax=Dyella sp. Tek66A03 TaxID=3458298 RepID=UPI00403E8789
MPKILPLNQPSALVDDAWLDQLQRAAFEYFPSNTNPSNGLVADTSRDGSPVSIAVVGLALSCYPVAVERGWIGRDEAARYCLAALRFFSASDQSGTPSATGYQGFYFHFLDMHTGTRVWQSELSMIDTALLIAGVLTAARYFSAATAQETELRELADALYCRIDWSWAQDGGATIRQGWKPECGFLHYGWEGYSEAIVLYALAMGSPTHPISAECYKAWTATYQWENLYDFDFLYAGPLFVHHYSHAWIDFRGIRDSFMQQKRSDYFENTRRATYIQREYAQRNPYEFAGYDENCWGLTACDGPVGNVLGVSGVTHRLFGYAARGVPFGPDDGTLSCPTVVASLPFAPDIALEAMQYMLTRYPQIITDGRLASSFNPTLADSEGCPWVSAGHYGLDQGVMMMMIENHRSGWLWALMRECPYLMNGLRKAGFAGGWLDQLAAGNAGVS